MKRDGSQRYQLISFLVLDPSMKLAYIKKHWGPKFVLRARTILATIVSLLFFGLVD